MKKVKQRVCAAALSLCMLLQLAPVGVLAADGTIPVAKALEPEVPLFSKQIQNHTDIKNIWLYNRESTKAMNAGKGFKRVSSQGLQTAPQQTLYDSFGTTLFHASDKAWWFAQWNWDYNSCSLFQELVAKGDIYTEISANMQYDSHRNFLNHWGKRYDHALIALTKDRADIRYVQTTTNKSGDQQLVRYGSNEWAKVNEGGTVMEFRANHTYCSCGSSKVVNPTVAFADVQGPNVPKIETKAGTDADRYYNKGTIEFTLTFDEPIRLANPNLTLTEADAEEYGLNLLAYDRKKNISITATAELTEIGERTMKFRYTIPENEPMDVVIKGFSSNQPFFKDADDFYVYTNDGYTPIPDAYKDQLKTSRVCDLAGNRLNDQWNTDVLFEDGQEIYIDTISPEFAGSQIQGSMISGESPGNPEAGQWPEGVDRSQVFAGVGDWMQLQIDFDEEIKLEDPKQVKATLNLKDGSGKPVTVLGEIQSTVKNGVDARIANTRIITEKFNIGSDWQTTEPGKPIRITEILMPAGTTDLCGNAFDRQNAGGAVTLTIDSIPAQQEYLDVTAPIINSGIIDDSGTNENMLCFRVQIQDQADASLPVDFQAAHMSGSNAVGDENAAESASFILNEVMEITGGVMPYEYYVSALPQPPADDGAWNTGIVGKESRFVTVEDGNYIFIRPAKSKGETQIAVKYPKMVIKGLDHAGNKAAEKTFELEPNAMFGDSTPPAAEAVFSQYANYDDGSGVKADMTVMDIGGLEEVRYKFDIDPEQGKPEYTGPAEDWTFVTSELSQDKNLVFKISEKTANMPVAGDGKHYVYLTVWAKDVYGNTSIQTFEDVVDWSLPSYSIEGLQGPTDEIIISRLNREEATKIGAKTSTVNFGSKHKNEPVSSFGSLYAYIPKSYLSGTLQGRPMLAVIDNLGADETGEPVSRGGIGEGESVRLIDDTQAYLESASEKAGPICFTQDAEGKYTDMYMNGIVAAFPGQLGGWNNLVAISGGMQLGDILISSAKQKWEDYAANYNECLQAAASPGTLYQEIEFYTIQSAELDYMMYYDGSNGPGEEQEANGYVPFWKITDIAKDGQTGIPSQVKKYSAKIARVAPDDTAPINKVEVGTPFTSDGKELEAYSSDGNDYYKKAGSTLHTLSEVRIPFTISNARVSEWGVEDVDFEASRMQLYEDGNPVGAPVQLAPNSAEQVYAFPSDHVYNCRKTYEVKVTLVAKVSRREEVYSLNAEKLLFCTSENLPHLAYIFYGRGASEYGIDGTILFEADDWTECPNYDPRPNHIVLHDSEDMFSENRSNNSYRLELPSNTKAIEKDIYTGEYHVDGRCAHNSVAEYWIWNAAAPEKVQVHSTYYASTSIPFVLVDSADEIITEPEMDFYGKGGIPLFRNRDNTLCYQLRTVYNGYTVMDDPELSPVYQLQVSFAEDSLPEAEMQAVPSDRIVQSVELAADVNSIYNIKDMYLSHVPAPQTSVPKHPVSLDESSRIIGKRFGERVSIKENNDYLLEVIDELGASANTSITIDNVDSVPPELTVNETSVEGGSYSLDLSLHDEGQLGEAFLYLTTKDPAAEDTEQTTDEKTYDTVIPWSEAETMECGSAASATGIYAIDAVYTEHTGDYENGRALDAKIEGAVSESGALWAYAVDAAGNRSETVQLFSGETYEAPKFQSVEKDPDGGVQLTFTGGVLLEEPSGAVRDSRYGKVKNNVPIYQDGTHTITYRDFFGKKYTETITVAVDGNFAADVKVSTLERTRDDVTVTVTSADENHLLKLTGCTVANPDGTPMAAEHYTVTIDEAGESAVIVMKENGVIDVGMSYGDEKSNKVIPINNIDREAAAELIWSYDAGEPAPGETVTQGPVTVHVNSADPEDELFGTNGALQYVFTEGKAGDSYTFEYCDTAGNTGSITAVLPVTIERYEPEPLGFHMEVSIKRSGVWYPLGQYSYAAGKEAYTLPENSPSMENKINIQPNRNEADVLILPEGTAAESITETTQSAAIDGVVQNGKNITITKNVNFVLAVRAGNEVIAMPLTMDNIHQLGEVDLIYATLDRFSRRVYFDPHGQDIKLTNTTGIAVENEHEQYRGYYYHDFHQNGDFIFYYEDAAGNKGNITASVRDLVAANVEPAAPIRWWPYHVGTVDGVPAPDETQLIQTPVNYDVTAQIPYNMNITEAALYYDNGSGGTGGPVPENIASLNISLDTVHITYRQNAEKTVLCVFGENGSDHILPIQAVSVIDKTAPEVSHNYAAGETMVQSKEIAFTPKEEVLCDTYPSAEYYSESNPMKVTVTESGDYTYVFRDKAGNQTSVTVTVTDVDSAAPVLKFKLDDSGKEYDSWDALRKEHEVTDITKIYLQANEDATLRFQENNISLNAGEWMDVAITHNGIYGMSVTDKAGNVTITSLAGIRIPDEDAPALFITPSRIGVHMGISEEELEKALRTGVTVSDNETPSDEITVTMDKSKLDITKKGVYEVYYTATDSSGNTGTGTRSVTVIGADDLTLMINGSLAAPMGTMVLDSGIVTFEVGNLTESNGFFEPYTIYVKKGFLTMGQMKNNSNKVQNNQAELYGSGFYTVYVVAQERRQYLTYLYIEQ